MIWMLLVSIRPVQPSEQLYIFKTDLQPKNSILLLISSFSSLSHTVLCSLPPRFVSPTLVSSSVSPLLSLPLSGWALQAGRGCAVIQQNAGWAWVPDPPSVCPSASLSINSPSPAGCSPNAHSEQNPLCTDDDAPWMKTFLQMKWTDAGVAEKGAFLPHPSTHEVWVCTILHTWKQCHKLPLKQYTVYTVVALWDAFTCM